MRLQLPDDLIQRLDFEQATRDELDDPVAWLPSRVVERSVPGHERHFGELVAAKCAAGFDVMAQEAVWAPKGGHIGRYRPITTLSLHERVVLRALTNEIADDVPDFDRSAPAQQAFQESVLGEQAEYIVIADVASFYFFVDHELLATRIVDASARADTAETVRLLLGGLVGRPYGLPQSFGPAQWLSELFIAPVERRLTRAGIRTFRNNDDFRLSAPTWGTALQSLERLQEEVSAVGLDLNGEKSWILRRETYEANLSLPDRLLIAAFSRSGGSAFTVDPYTGEPIEEEDDIPDDEPSSADQREAKEPDPFDPDGKEPAADSSEEDVDPFAEPEEDVIGPAVLAALRSAVEERRDSSNPLTGFQSSANRRVVSSALAYFGRIKSSAAVELGRHMLALDPFLARQYASYLAALQLEGAQASQEVIGSLNAFRGHAPYWTQAWLMNALLGANVGLSDEIVRWLEAFLSSRAPGVLRARAALVLAAHKKTSVEQLSQIFDAMPEPARPDIVAALSLLSNDSTASVRAVVGNDRLFGWISDYAREHRAEVSTM